MADKSNGPYFAVVIPTLNEEKHISHLLKDLRQQSFMDFEVVVVDGGSKDTTQKIVRGYGAKLIISGRKNVSYQRNLGADQSHSEWIVFMDADNRIPKSYLEKIKKYLESESPDILSTWIKPDSSLNEDKLTATIMNLFMDINKNTKKPYVLESMLIIKRGVFSQIRGFDTEVPWAEGGALLEKAVKMGFTYDFIKYPKYTYSFRRIKKVGKLRILQEMSQMEIIKVLRGGLTKKQTEFLYPMEGGKQYGRNKMKKLTLKEFISLLFD